MKNDADKTRAELINELNALRAQAKMVCAGDDGRVDLQACFDQYGQTAECNEIAMHMAELIIAESPVILFRRLAGDDPRLVYVSSNIDRFGYSAESFLTGEIQYKEIVYPPDFEKVGADIKANAEKEINEYIQTYRIVTKSGEIRWVEDQTSVVFDPLTQKSYNQGLVVDISARKEAEKKLSKSEEKYRRIVETAGEGFVLMDQDLAVIDINEAFCELSGYNRDELLGKTPLDLIGDAYQHFMRSNREELLSRAYPKIDATIAAKSGRQIPVLIHRNTLRDDQGGLIGQMAFVTDMTAHKKALALAAEVQKSLLPQKGPAIPGVDIAGRNISCDEVGGDYFDFIWRREKPDSPFSVIVGDISGHGVESALLMTTARAFLRMRASQPGTVSEIVSTMNRQLSGDMAETDKFMTLFYLTFDIAKQHIEWVRAGHDPALIYDPQKDHFEELKGSGVALGIDDKYDYVSSHKTGLANGQIISVGTDGIWEARDKDGRMFGKERFKEIIRNNAESDADTILKAVFDDLARYGQGRRNEDDITLVIVKINAK
jgi:phosphoserine phosphatase RsbU/P